MEKRTLVAILLIVIIFILTPYYYEWVGIKPKPVVSQSDSLMIDSTMINEDSLKMALEGSDEKIQEERIAQVTDASAKSIENEISHLFYSSPDTHRIIIDNDFFKVVLSTENGGNFKAFFLKNYEHYKGGYVNLIEDNGLDFEFLSRSGQKTNFYHVNAFLETVNSDSVSLKASDEYTVSFLVKDANMNPVYKRTFIFRGHDYRVKVLNTVYQPQSYMKGRFYQIGWRNGIPLVEENIFDDSGYQDALVYMGDELEFITADKEEKEETFNGKVDWVAARNKYFSIYLKPLKTEKTENAIIKSFSVPDSLNPKLLHKKYDTFITYELENISGVETDSLVLYLGPLDYGILKQYGWNFETLVLNKGWYERFLRPISLLLLAIFKFLHQFIPNYGLVIIVFSILLKILLFPLTKKSYQSMKEMQLLQPVIQEIREKYKDNPQKMNQELMGLYKKYGVNPMGGCLPMLLQMPVLFALFVVFRSTIQLRGQEFFLWITDLSAPDKLYLGFSLPFIGNNIHVLPILSAVSMIFQSKQQSTGSQNQMLVYFMPLFFMFFLYNFPSGLHLYYFVFNVLTFIQQKYIKEPVPLDQRALKTKVGKKNKK